MKIRIITSIAFLAILLNCFNTKNVDQKDEQSNDELQQSNSDINNDSDNGKKNDYNEILIVKPNLSEEYDNETLVLSISEKEELLITLKLNESEEPVYFQPDYYFPCGYKSERGCISLDKYDYLNYLNQSFGFKDINNDGIDEIFFNFAMASDNGLYIIGFKNRKFYEITYLSGFAGFYQYNNDIILLEKYIMVGAAILDSKLNKYKCYKFENNQLKVLQEMPDSIYNELYNQYKCIELDIHCFRGLFFFLYNNSPNELNEQFILSEFKSDDEVDKKYKDLSNFTELLNDYKIGIDALYIKYYYLYWLNELNN